MGALWHQHGKLRRVFAAVLVGVLIFAGAFLVLCLDGTAGNVTKQNNKLTVDMSHITEGYFLASCKPTGHTMKLRVSFGEELLTYDLDNTGLSETFPLQFGNGEYAVMLYENIGGKKYSQAGKVTIQVNIDDERAAFLKPNQYVNYTDDSPAVLMAKEACAGLQTTQSTTGNTLWGGGAVIQKEPTERDKFEAVKKLVLNNFTYDYLQAATVKTGSLPDIDRCCEKRMGICQDLSAMTVCMLRSLGIYAKLVIGYADTAYHAWVVAYIDGEEILFDPTYELHAMKKPAAYTVERYY